MNIKVQTTALPGVKILTRDYFVDDRGEFVDVYALPDYHAVGITTHFIQDNYSISRAGVFRGFHGDFRTTKLLHVPHGSYWAVLVDLRPWSETFGKYIFIYLNQWNHAQLLVPPGIGNGAYCLENNSVYVYKQDQLYLGANRQFTLRWDFVPWLEHGVQTPLHMSARDQDTALSFEELRDKFAAIIREGGNNDPQGCLRRVY